MFKRVLIANRGVVAQRIVRACADLGIESVVAASDIDASLPYTSQATSMARLPGYRPQDTYLNSQAIIEAAQAVGADAIHPGYGFLAESAAFADEVARAGMCFIGPSPRWIEEMGEKTRARQLMADKAFPVHAGSDVIEDERALLEQAERIGFPVILKPAGGGGGIGMSVVHEPRYLLDAYRTAQALAGRSFGNAAVYLEKYLERPRHIEIQLIGDGESVVGLFERDCSVQRRHQKVIEEAPAPGIERGLIAELQTSAARALAGYDNIGTVETLLAGGEFGFLEMNTRLQVEHAVTEQVTGLDLVGIQMRLAAGERIGQVLPDAPTLDGFAVEARLYAEDGQKMLPSTGRLRAFRAPQMTGVRIDAGYAEGCTVTPYYDPLLAKVIGWGTTREQAIGRTLIALKAFEVDGIQTNAPLLRRVLGSEPFIMGRVHTALLDDLI